MISRGERGDGPLASAANFRVFIDGGEVGFSRVSGLASEDADAASARERRVVLRRAVTGDRQLYEWRERHAAGRGDAREVVIEVWTADYSEPVASWALVDAYPVRWTGPVLDAVVGGVAVEELEVSYSRLEWRFPKPHGGER